MGISTIAKRTPSAVLASITTAPPSISQCSIALFKSGTRLRDVMDSGLIPVEGFSDNRGLVVVLCD
jgi:hypothetical protein